MNENENNDVVKSGLNVASLVLGIISIVSALFWYITIPSGVLSIIFGAKGVKKTGSKVGKAGLILGIIGLGLFLFIYISLIIIILLSSYM